MATVTLTKAQIDELSKVIRGEMYDRTVSITTSDATRACDAVAATPREFLHITLDGRVI